MTPSQWKKTLEQAVKNLAPQAYAKMEADGTLEGYLRNLLANVSNTVAQMQDQAINSHVTQGNPQYVADPLTRTQAINQDAKSADETALSQAVEEIRSLEAQQDKTTELP